MNFTLDENLDWHPPYHRQWNSYLIKDTVTNQDLAEVLKGHGACAMMGSDDSKEFKALRNQLEAEGYIRCQRSWWNGDSVLKPFSLNGVEFNVDEQFPSGAAMKIHLKYARKYKEEDA